MSLFVQALELAQRVTATDGDALKGNRSVWFKDGGRLECRVLDRDRMAAGSDLMGPTIIESLDSTIVVPPGWSARLDDKGFITMGRV